MTGSFPRYLTVRDVYDSLLSPTGPSMLVHPLEPGGQLSKTRLFVNHLLDLSIRWFSGFKDRLPPLEKLLLSIFTTTRKDHDFSRTRKAVVLRYVGYAMHRSLRLFDNELNHPSKHIPTRQALKEVIDIWSKSLSQTSSSGDAMGSAELPVHDNTKWILDRAIQFGENFSKRGPEDKKLNKYLTALKSTLSSQNFESIKPNEWTDWLAICISPLVIVSPSIPHSYVRSNNVVHEVIYPILSLTYFCLL